MSRVDVPTLKCDRCGYTTSGTDLHYFTNLQGYKLASPKGYDLCPKCWKAFTEWLKP